MSSTQPAKKKSFKEQMEQYEADNPTWQHFHRRAHINKWSFTIVGLLGGGYIGGGLAGDGWESWISLAWAAGIGPLIALILGFLGYRVSSVGIHLEKPKRRLNVSNGFNPLVHIPLNAIAYIGKAKFTTKDLFRLTRLRLLNETGPGMEIVTTRGQYITISTNEADEIIKAMLESGLNPNAVRIPFPVNAVSDRWKDVDREQRSSPGRPTA